MPNNYHSTTALHYAAYRPQLHGAILNNCLGAQQFKQGLDIGCPIGAECCFWHSNGVVPTMVLKAPQKELLP